MHIKNKKKTNTGVPVPASAVWRLPHRQKSEEKRRHRISPGKYFSKWKHRRKKRRSPRWQKIWFALSIVCLTVTVILGIYRSHVSSSLSDQNEWKRWDVNGERTAQVSCFYADAGTVSEDSVRELNYNISKSLENASIKASGDNANLFIWSASGRGSTTLSYKKNQSTVTAIGVLGDFFDFHLFHYLSGGPFVTDSGMRDQIIIDEYTAWKLFGSSNVVGKTVEIGGVNHLISGVIQRPSGRFMREAGISDDTSICIMSYKSLLQYTSSEAVTTQENGQDSGSGGQSTGTDSQQNQDSGDSQNVGWMNRLGEMLSVNVQAADAGAEVSSDGSAVQESVDTESTAPEADTSSTADTSSSAGTSSSQVSEESGSTGTTAASGTETPAEAQTQDNTLPEGTGTQNTSYTDSGRINCYEVVMPEPVSGFAGNIVRQRTGNSSNVRVVVNSSRFGTRALLADLGEFAVRGMETSGYTLPYWENVARGWESVLSLVVLVQILLTAVPVVFALVMIIYYFRHKTWTAGSIFRKMKDGIYDRQSEKKYGKNTRAPGLSTLTDDYPEADKIPDLSGQEENDKK